MVMVEVEEGDRTEHICLKLEAESRSSPDPVQ
jgi:hypothetical protein